MSQNIQIRTTCETCKYITPGKVYEARVLDEQIVLVIDDTGSPLKTRLPGSSHLNGQVLEVLQDC
tara:strand:+ start:1071 stop:1265 length:195 start_codon:yes stop_codon:yes gene_type:complete